MAPGFPLPILLASALAAQTQPAATAPVLIVPTGQAPARVPVGREFAINLRENPTTGYRWRVVALPPGVRATGSDYVSSNRPGQPRRRGAGGMVTFRFLASAPTRGQISLELRGPGRSGRTVSRQSIDLVAR